MNHAILGAACLALAAAFWGASSLLLIGVGIVLAICLFVVSEDLRRLRRTLALIITRGRGQCAFFSAATSEAKNLSQLIEALVFRAQALQTEAEIHRRAERSLTAALADEGQSIVDTASSPSEAAQSYLTLLAGEIARRTTAKAAALVIECKDDEGQTRFTATSGVNSRRFEAALHRKFLPFFAWGNRDCFEPSQRDSSHEEFELHGFKASLCCPIEAVQQELIYTGALWVGFPGGGHEAQEQRLKLLAEEASVCCGKFLETLRLKNGVKEAEAASRHRVEAIAHFSHDLRSPLHNIRAVLQLLQSEEHDIEKRSFLTSAIKNCDHLGQVVGDLIDFSRLHLGNLHAQCAEFSLTELVADVADAYQASAHLKGLSFHVEQPEESYLVHADKNQIRRVLSNLISNAIKYTKRGGIKVTLLGSADGFISVRVQDTGLGMTADQLAKLFSPFTRFHADAADGIGIGLALSRVLTELNHGSLHAVSQEGRGSEFQLLLPGRVSHRGVAVKGSSELTPRVLLVDDDPDCLHSLSNALTRLGLAVEQAHDAASALHFLSRERFDAVISDVSMPKGGLGKLLDGFPSLPVQPPIAALSGDARCAEELKARGVSEVMLKPADPTDIKRWVISVAYVSERQAAMNDS